MEESKDENRCRICLQRHELVYSLFGRQKGSPRSPSAGLRKLGVKIKIPGPNSICEECLRELEAALNFLEKCEQSNQKLAEQLVETAPRETSVGTNNNLLNFEQKVSDGGEDGIEDRVEGGRDAWNASHVGLDTQNSLKPNTHTCNICQKVFNRRFNLKLHLQRHSGDFDWACPACGARVVSRWAARRHCQPRPRRACPVPGCHKTYTTQHNLNTHIRAHTGERPFECSECGKKFTSKNTLADHIRIHTGVKPYMCPVCGKRFTTNKLAAHMWTHSTPAPAAARPAPARPARRHACRLCPNTYNHKQSLNKHKPDAGDTETKNIPEVIERPVHT